MKSIVIFSNTSWSIYNFRKSLIELLAKKGHKIFVMAPVDEYSERVKSELPCEFIPLKNLNAKGTGWMEDLRLIIECRQIFKTFRFDVLMSYTIKPNIYGNLASVGFNHTIVNTVNGLGYGLSSNGLLSLLLHALYWLAFKRSTYVIFQNQDDKNFFEARHMTPKHKMKLVNGSGIDLESFTVNAKFNPQAQTIRFLLSARLVKEKGINEYIKAATQIKEEYPETRFMMAGMKADNPSAVDESTFSQETQQGVIDFLGAVDNMNNLLEETDVLVLPSYYREGVPRILLEGLSKGIPIITTNHVGCKETVVDGVNGFLIPIQDTQALAAAMRKMIQLPVEARKEMSAQSRKLAMDKFDVKQVNSTYLDCLN